MYNKLNNKSESLNIVAIGGGHGLGRVLSAFSFLQESLTGIVATTDNGGSTGKLRKRVSTIAFGDLRNCLTQLLDDDSIGAQLFNFRFEGPDELGGHNLGNLILYALSQINSKPMDAIKLIRRLLKIKTQVFPMSESPTDLLGFYPKGQSKVGELCVDQMLCMPENLMLAPLVKAPSAAITAIQQADIILLGPGSFLTSIVPPLLVSDIAKALNQSKAKKLFIENIQAEQSPAGALSLDQKLQWFKQTIGTLPIDAVLCQDCQTSEHVEVIQTPLADEAEPNYHCKQKLVEAVLNYWQQQPKPLSTKNAVNS